MMELTETFLKLITIAIIVVGVLSLYFSFIGYNVTVEARSGERDAVILGNSLLSSKCLIYENTENVFSEEKLDDIVVDSTCLTDRYPKYGSAQIKLQDDFTKTWKIILGPADVGGEVKFYAAVRTHSGEVKPAFLVVTV